MGNVVPTGADPSGVGVPLQAAAARTRRQRLSPRKHGMPLDNKGLDLARPLVTSSLRLEDPDETLCRSP